MALLPITSSDESLAKILEQLVLLVAQSKDAGTSGTTSSTAIVDKLGVIAIQLETANMVALMRAARNPLLVGSPFLQIIAKRLNMDPAMLVLAAQR